MPHQVSKTFGHTLGWSVAFRQWRAASHCRFLHGYALAIRLTFEVQTLNAQHWVIDFGGMKDLQKSLEEYFDHKTLIAHDDPDLDWFRDAHQRGFIDLRVVPATSCEAFAEQVFDLTNQWLAKRESEPSCKLIAVEVSEHGANSASYRPTN